MIRILAITLLFFVSCEVLIAQPITTTQEKRKKPVVNYNTGAFFYPFAAIADNFRVALEHRPNQTLGLRGVFNYGFGEDPFFYNVGNGNFNGSGHINEFTSFSGEFQVRYYPVQGNPTVYTGAFANGRTINLSVNDELYFDSVGNPLYTLRQQSARAFGFGVLGGMQFQIAKVFLLDAYIGAGPNIPSGEYRLNSRGIAGFRKGMRYNGGLSFGVILFK